MELTVLLINVDTIIYFFFKQKAPCTISKNELENGLIGRLIYDSKLKIKAALIKNSYETIELEYSPLELCFLPDETMILLNHEGKCMTLYDKNNQFMKNIVYNINDNQTAFAPTFIEKSETHLYLSDPLNSKILRTDFSFNSTIIIESSNDRTNPLYLMCPLGMCFYKNYLYVCDHDNYCIKKFDYYLDFDRSFTIFGAPYQIKIANDIACIRVELDIIAFFKIENFELIRKYERHESTIACFNDTFYEYSHKNQKFYFYNKNGQLSDEIEVKHFDKETDGILFINDDVILISDSQKKLLLKFPLNKI